MPGNNGGVNYGGSAIDPAHGYLYVVSKDLPAMLKLTLPPLPPTGTTPEARGSGVYATNCSVCHGDEREGHNPVIPTLVNIHARLTDAQILDTVRYGKNQMPAFGSLSTPDLDNLLAFLKNPGAPRTIIAGAATGDVTALHYRSGFGFMYAKSGLSVIAPPWTTLTAYDLNTGNVRWKVPLGEVPELAAKGVTNTGAQFPKVGPVVTAGGLIFTGTHDRKVRATDASTGKVLWEHTVDAALEGMPAVVPGGRAAVCRLLRRREDACHHAAGREARTTRWADPWGLCCVCFAAVKQAKALRAGPAFHSQDDDPASLRSASPVTRRFSHSRRTCAPVVS